MQITIPLNYNSPKKKVIHVKIIIPEEKVKRPREGVTASCEPVEGGSVVVFKVKRPESGVAVVLK